MEREFEVDVDVSEDGIELIETSSLEHDAHMQEILSTLTNNRGKQVTSATTPGNIDLPKYLHRCNTCHYVVFQDELPEGFVCPNCGLPASNYQRYDLSQGLDLFGQEQ